MLPCWQNCVVARTPRLLLPLLLLLHVVPTCHLAKQPFNTTAAELPCYTSTQKPTTNDLLMVCCAATRGPTSVPPPAPFQWGCVLIIHPLAEGLLQS
jgi:hypothetical protein